MFVNRTFLIGVMVLSLIVAVKSHLWKKSRSEASAKFYESHGRGGKI